MPSVHIHRVGLALVVGAGVVVLAATGGWTQTPPSRTQSKAKVNPKINDAFKKPNVRDYVKRFESETRENYAHAARDRRRARVGAGHGRGRHRRRHRVLHPTVRREGRADGQGLCRGYRAPVPRAHRRRGQEAGAEPGRHDPGQPGLDQPAPANRSTSSSSATCIITWRSPRRRWPRSTRRCGPAAGWS